MKYGCYTAIVFLSFSSSLMPSYLYFLCPSFQPPSYDCFKNPCAKTGLSTGTENLGVKAPNSSRHNYSKNTCKFEHNYVSCTSGFICFLVTNLMKILATQKPGSRRKTPEITMKFCFALWPCHRQSLDNRNVLPDFTVRF